MAVTGDDFFPFYLRRKLLNVDWYGLLVRQTPSRHVSLGHGTRQSPWGWESEKKRRRGLETRTRNQKPSGKMRTETRKKSSLSFFHALCVATLCAATC